MLVEVLLVFMHVIEIFSEVVHCLNVVVDVVIGVVDHSSDLGQVVKPLS